MKELPEDSKILIQITARDLRWVIERTARDAVVRNEQRVKDRLRKSKTNNNG